MLITLNGMLDADELQQFIAQLQVAHWQDGAATAGAMARQVKHNQQLDDDHEVAIRLSQYILHKLERTQQFIAAALPRRIYPPKFNRYAQGGNYGAHVDSALMLLPKSTQRLRSDLSATLFLNEPDEYDGGELEIEGEFGVQTVKLAAGDMVLYPSSSLHRVTPVTRGARVASFFWIESLVPDEGARALLYDLDQSIQQLMPRMSADDPQLLKLTGIYHNLLRRWAST